LPPGKTLFVILELLTWALDRDQTSYLHRSIFEQPRRSFGGLQTARLRGKYDLSFTVPSQCAEQLCSGNVDVAIIPAIEYQRIDDLAILPDMAIASKKQVRSLLIIAKKAHRTGEELALDASSRSTQTLTRILCAEKWKIAPQCFEAQPNLGTMLKPSRRRRS